MFRVLLGGDNFYFCLFFILRNNRIGKNALHVSTSIKQPHDIGFVCYIFTGHSQSVRLNVERMLMYVKCLSHQVHAKLICPAGDLTPQ